MKVAFDELMEQLPKPANGDWPQGVPFTPGFAHGTMSLEVFAPRGTDHQQPHDQDELYVVMKGSAEFLHEGERTAAAAGDVLFVPAGDAHHFENMSDDFATWVIFWGPQGGEAGAGSAGSADGEN